MSTNQTFEQAKHFFLEGLRRFKNGEYEIAEINYRQSLALVPNRESTLSNLCLALLASNKINDVEQVVINLNILFPKNKNHILLAIEAYSKQKNWNAVLNYVDQLLDLGIPESNGYYQRAMILIELRRFSEAITYFDKSVLLNKHNAEAYFGRGNAYQALGQFEEAVSNYELALINSENYFEAYVNRGIAFVEMRLFHRAHLSFESAIKLNPTSAEAHFGRGNALAGLGQTREAVNSFQQAINLKSDFADAYFNKSVNLLLEGDYAEGWRLHEWRWKGDVTNPERNFPVPIWLGGSTLVNKTILLHAEQGLGDSIQFCRYAKLVKSLGATTLLEVPKGLIGLLSDLDGVDLLIQSGEPLPPFDYHCPLLSLPLAFNTCINTIPSSGAYLKINHKKREKWAHRLGMKTKPRVGIVWSSTSNYKNDVSRSMCLSSFLEHLPVNNLDLVCLQKEIKSVDRAYLNFGDQIKYFGDELNDFSDTNGLASCMDLVISTCTSVPHMTAALGIETWLLLAHVPDWRWLKDRDESPWYDSMKLYRQGSDKEWTPVLTRVAKDLGVRFGI